MRKLTLLLAMLIIFLHAESLQNLLELGDYKKLLVQSKDAVYAEESAQNYFYLGAAYAGVGRYALAESAFTKTLEYDDYSLKMANYMAAYYEQRDNDDQAIAIYEKIIRKFSKNTQGASLKLGELYFKQKKYREAIAIFSDFIYKDESKANPLGYFVGMGYYTLADMNNAEKYFLLAKAKGYESADLDIKLGDLLIRKGKYKQGADLMSAGISRTDARQASATYLLLADAYTKINDLVNARKMYELAIASGARKLKTFLDYGYAATQTKDFSGLLSVYEEYEKLFLDSSDYLYYQANAYEQLNDYEKAVNYYQRVLDSGYKNREQVKAKMNEIYSKMNNAI